MFGEDVSIILNFYLDILFFSKYVVFLFSECWSEKDFLTMRI